MLAATSASADVPLLVLGVVANERRVRWRERLRQLYAPFAGKVLVKYVLEDSKSNPRRKYTPAADEVMVPVVRGGDRHCAHKMVGWWSMAQRWPGAFYAKTDDDAALDLPRLLPIIEGLPRRGLYSGILRYSSMNESSLEGVCWSAGAYGALNKRVRDPACVGSVGPIVFAEGPFVLMSSDVQQWVAPRLRKRAHA
jgi:hypothetical protein